MKPIKFIDKNLLESEHDIWKNVMCEDRDSFLPKFQDQVRKIIVRILYRGQHLSKELYEVIKKWE